MPVKVDFLVIGAGPAGICAASALAAEGARTAIIGKQIGGSYCCDGYAVLSALTHVSSLFDKARQLDAFLEGAPADRTLDFKKVRKYVESYSGKFRKSFADRLDESGAEYTEGFAEFTGPNKVVVRSAEGSEKTFVFKKCLLAVGSANKKLDILSGKKNMDFSSVLSFDGLPSSVVIIGGGLVGVEAASLFSRFGSRVTIVEKSDRILSVMDQAVVKKYEDLLKKKEIEVLTGENVQKIERIGQKYVILFEEKKLESEEVFVCIGRTPLTENIGLDKAGIVTDDGIPIYDDNLRTSNPNVYVAGDVTGSRFYSGWVFHSASVAARNMTGGDMKYNARLIPTVLSGDPEAASVGLCEEEAKRLGYDAGTVKYSSSASYRAAAPSCSPLFVKAVYDKASRRCLGVQAAGGGAGETVSVFSVIIQSGLTLDMLDSLVYTDPLIDDLASEISEKIK